MADMKKFLDQQGVGTLWSEVLRELTAKADKSKLEELTTKVGTLEENVGEVNISELESDLTTAKDALSTLQEAMKNKLEAKDLATIQEAIDLLNDEDNIEGSVAYAVAQAVTSIVDGADDRYDTLKEIANWILSDQSGAAKMSKDIEDAKTSIAALKSLVGSLPMESEYDDVIEWLTALENTVDGINSDIGDLSDLVDRVETAEGDITELKTTTGTLTTTIGTIPADAKSKNVVDYVKEVADSITVAALTEDEIKAITNPQE